MRNFFVSAFRICIVYVTLLALTSLQNFRIWSLADKMSPVCQHPVCRKLGDYYLKNLERKVDPCTDFYSYVCNGWAKQNPSPKFEDRWTTKNILTQRRTKDLENLLSNKNNHNTTEFRRAKELYKACMSLPFFEKSRPVVVRNEMFKVNFWPMFSNQGDGVPSNIAWWQLQNEYVRLTSENSMFDSNLIYNPEKPNEITIELKALFSPYGMLRPGQNWGTQQPDIEHYKEFLRKVIHSVTPKNLKYANFQQNIEHDLIGVLRFRDNLRKAIVDSKPIETKKIMTIRNFHDWYNHLTDGDVAKIHWLDTIRSIYNNIEDHQGAIISHDTKILVHEHYFHDLAHLLKRTSKRDIVNHLHIYFAERHLQLNAEMEEQLQLSYNNHIVPTGSARNDMNKVFKCVNEHSMPDTLARMYVHAHFSRNNKADVEHIIEEATFFLSKQIEESTWLSEEWKTKSIEKVHAITSFLGYPDEYDSDFHTSRVQDMYQLSPLEPDAYYIKPRNILGATASFLQWIMYEREMPYVVKYGATYSILGHEMYHALDSEGIQVGSTGEKPWWPKTMIDKYTERTRCVKDQYNAERNKEIANQKIHLSSLPSTLNEDLSDIMGLRLAYKAYKAEQYKRKGVCDTLPGFEKMNCNRLFFIAFANTMCSKFTPSGVQFTLAKDVHSLPNIRVNTAVSNLQEFADAFECKRTSALYPKNKCNIWKDEA